MGGSDEENLFCGQTLYFENGAEDSCSWREEMIGGGQGWKGERAEKINNDTSEYEQLPFQRPVSRGEQSAKAELSRYFYQGRR